VKEQTLSESNSVLTFATKNLHQNPITDIRFVSADLQCDIYPGFT